MPTGRAFGSRLRSMDQSERAAFQLATGTSAKAATAFVIATVAVVAPEAPRTARRTKPGGVAFCGPTPLACSQARSPEPPMRLARGRSWGNLPEMVRCGERDLNRPAVQISELRIQQRSGHGRLGGDRLHLDSRAEAAKLRDAQERGLCDPPPIRVPAQAGLDREPRRRTGRTPGYVI